MITSVYSLLIISPLSFLNQLARFASPGTFVTECFFDGEYLPADSDRVQWIARHTPLSASRASNVPGHETPHCYVTDGESDRLVGAMMRGLSAICDAAFDIC